MQKAIATLPQKKAPPRPTTTAEAGLLFLNELEKDAAETVKQLKNVVITLEAVIAAIERPKKWKFNIDRNFTTGRIQEITAEQVE